MANDEYDVCTPEYYTSLSYLNRHNPPTLR
jgi:hypothetical protein